MTRGIEQVKSETGKGKARARAGTGVLCRVRFVNCQLWRLNVVPAAEDLAISHGGAGCAEAASTVAWSSSLPREFARLVSSGGAKLADCITAVFIAPQYMSIRNSQLVRRSIVEAQPR